MKTTKRIVMVIVAISTIIFCYSQAQAVTANDPIVWQYDPSTWVYSPTSQNTSQIASWYAHPDQVSAGTGATGTKYTAGNNGTLAMQHNFQIVRPSDSQVQGGTNFQTAFDLRDPSNIFRPIGGKLWGAVFDGQVHSSDDSKAVLTQMGLADRADFQAAIGALGLTVENFQSAPVSSLTLHLDSNGNIVQVFTWNGVGDPTAAGFAALYGGFVGGTGASLLGDDGTNATVGHTAQFFYDEATATAMNGASFATFNGGGSSLPGGGTTANSMAHDGQAGSGNNPTPAPLVPYNNPELPPGAMQMIMMSLGGGLCWFRKFKKSNVQ